MSSSQQNTGQLTRALREHFGFAEFRGVQEQVIRHLMADHDALVIMATGDGKSLCYQLPALMHDGLTLVVSPLIALMDDQVAALRARGLPATCIHSLLERHEREERLAATLAGEIRLLYVTPERFRVPGFAKRIRAAEVALLAVDEAHCVSHWGHDFRPDYRKLGEVREVLGNPPCVALTATATPRVQEEILEVLGMPQARVFHTGIERPNLFLAAQELHDPEQKVERVLDVVQRVGGPGIVYTALIKDLLRLEEHLLRRGYEPLVYHGKLSSSERGEMQDRFIASPNQLILATNAFGMGVDKPDIRFILHYQVPGTLEAYYQEIGRAGRDGKGSLCELLYVEDDVAIQRNFTEWANPDQRFLEQVVHHLQGLGERLHATDVQDLRETFLIKNRHDGRIETCLRLLRTAGCIDGEPGQDLRWIREPTPEEIVEWLPEAKLKSDLMGLLNVVQYAKTDTCRKRVVHHHFGLELEADCGSCDVCVPSGDWLDQHVPETLRRAIPRRDPSGEDPTADQDKGVDPSLQRGDWIEVRGHGLCAVTRVHKMRKGMHADVERARDLQSLSLDLGRVRWRRVDR